MSGFSRKVNLSIFKVAPSRRTFAIDACASATDIGVESFTNRDRKRTTACADYSDRYQLKA